jgi:hypothetical protein
LIATAPAPAAGITRGPGVFGAAPWPVPNSALTRVCPRSVIVSTWPDHPPGRRDCTNQQPAPKSSVRYGTRIILLGSGVPWIYFLLSQRNKESRMKTLICDVCKRP